MPKKKFSPWKTLKKRSVFTALPWIKVDVEEVLLPDGTIVSDYHQVNLPEYAIIFAMTSEKKVIMQRQYRHGVGRASLLLPGGMIEDRETPEEAAKRELLEETGYISDQWENLGSFVANANYGCGKAHLFVTNNAIPIDEPNSQDLEDMEMILMDIKELIEAVKNQEVVVLSVAMAIALATNPGFETSFFKTKI